MSQLTLKCEKFGLSRGLQNLLTSGDLVDVTLACQGQFIQAHKTVLAACSPHFRAMFKLQVWQQPIVFMYDVELILLQALVDFMYNGEVTVNQKDLTGLLKLADALKVTGLATQNDEFCSDNESQDVTTLPPPAKIARHDFHSDISTPQPEALPTSVEQINSDQVKQALIEEQSWLPDFETIGTSVPQTASNVEEQETATSVEVEDSFDVITEEVELKTEEFVIVQDHGVEENGEDSYLSDQITPQKDDSWCEAGNGPSTSTFYEECTSTPAAPQPSTSSFYEDESTSTPAAPQSSTSTFSEESTSTPAAPQPSTSSFYKESTSLPAAPQPSTSTFYKKSTSLPAAPQPSTSTKKSTSTPAASQPSTSTFYKESTSKPAAPKPSTSKFYKESTSKPAAPKPHTTTFSEESTSTPAAPQPSTSTVYKKSTSTFAAPQPSTSYGSSTSRKARQNQASTVPSVSSRVKERRLKDNFRDPQATTSAAETLGNQTCTQECNASTTLLKCVVCPQIFKNRTSLNVHYKSKHPTLRRIPCRICKVKFLSKEQLKKHKLKYHSKECYPYVCTKCGAKFTYNTDLKRHFKSLHGGNVKIIKGLNIQCGFCFKKCKTLNEKLEHVKKLHPEFCFQCRLCARVFFCKNMRQRHELCVHRKNIDNPEKFFPCTLCVNVCTSQVLLEKHVTQAH